MKNGIMIICKPTHECNMNCEYCYDRKEKKLVKNKTIPMNILEHAIKISLKSFKNINWIWHGGEATIMGKDFFEKAKKIFDENMTEEHHIEFYIQSNGKNFDDTRDWLNELKIKPGYSYDLTNENKLRKEKLNFIDKIKEDDGVISVISDPNTDLVEIYKKYGNKKMISFNKIFFIEPNKKYDVGEFANRFIELFEYSLFTKNMNIEKNIKDYITIACSSTKDAYCSAHQCLGTILNINPDGNIFSCDRFGIGDLRYRMGNVLDFEYIDECFLTEGFINLIKDDFEFRKKNCEKCSIKYFCKNICKGNRINEEGNVDVSKINQQECEFRRLVISYIFNRIFNLKQEELLLINEQIYKIIFENKFIFKFLIEELERKGIKNV